MTGMFFFVILVTMVTNSIVATSLKNFSVGVCDDVVCTLGFGHVTPNSRLMFIRKGSKDVFVYVFYKIHGFFARWQKQMNLFFLSAGTRVKIHNRSKISSYL